MKNTTEIARHVRYTATKIVEVALAISMELTTNVTNEVASLTESEREICSDVDKAKTTNYINSNENQPSKANHAPSQLGTVPVFVSVQDISTVTHEVAQLTKIVGKIYCDTVKPLKTDIP